MKAKEKARRSTCPWRQTQSQSRRPRGWRPSNPPSTVKARAIGITALDRLSHNEKFPVVAETWFAVSVATDANFDAMTTAGIQGRWLFGPCTSRRQCSPPLLTFSLSSLDTRRGSSRSTLSLNPRACDVGISRTLMLQKVRYRSRNHYAFGRPRRTSSRCSTNTRPVT